MIKNLIFDFGDVFLNLNKPGAMRNALDVFQIEKLTDEMVAINCLYEQGLVSTSVFINFYFNYFPHISRKDVIKIWNYVLVEFPKYKFEFLQNLRGQNKYKLILLSNTNELHMEWVKNQVPFYIDFKNCFDRFYLSHEINLRKPDRAIFEFVIQENNLVPSETLFIDDTKENTDAANQIGIHTWNIDENSEDIVNLFTVNKNLF
ncbi:MAG: HAD-IA family hydrolase [Flavobacteriaceae bacterium]|nr:HAD-IA family hydrolase [Flavobacteriaceae bacterium]